MMTTTERDALKAKYKRPTTKLAREKARWERMLAHTNNGKATEQQMKEAKR